MEHDHSQNSTPDDPDSFFGMKLRSMFIILVIGVIGGLIPLKRQAPHIQSLGNCFSGGVFISAALVHMLAESVEGFGEIEGHEKSAFIFCMAGIFLPFFIEKMLLSRYSQASTVLLAAGSKGNVGIKATVHIYLLLLMLSMHSLIEGIALGVQTTTKGINTLFWAISAHKFFDSFALGISLVKAELPTKTVVQMITLLSSMTPFGIVIGMMLTAAISNTNNNNIGSSGEHVSTTENSVIAESIKAIAAGTFIYVALVEVVMEEFGGHSHGHTHTEKDKKDIELGSTSVNTHDHDHDEDHSYHDHHHDQPPNLSPTSAAKLNKDNINKDNNKENNNNNKEGNGMKWQKFGMLVLGMIVMSVLSMGEHGHSHSHSHKD